MASGQGQRIKTDLLDLPSQILQFITSHLTEISDFFRFRAVCKTWRTSLPPSAYPPLGPPWILEAGQRNSFRFYSFSSGKIYNIRCPPSYCKMLDGPSDGYMLVLFNRNRLDLVNPINGDHMSLPCLNITVSYTLDAIHAGEYVVVSGLSKYIFNYNHNIRVLAFCRPNDEKWTYTPQPRNCNLRCSTIYKGKFIYIEDGTGDTKAIDISTLSRNIAYAIPPVENDSRTCSLVHSGGDILLVTNNNKRTMSNITLRFNVYKLDDRNEMNRYHEPQWIKISNIGDQILFLDGLMQGLSIASTNVANFRVNCIYFLSDTLYEYDIENGTAKKLYCPVLSVCSGPSGPSSTWFIPRIQ